MATPFRPDETLDLEGFGNAVRFMEAAGADGCTIVGVLGESNRLTDRERARLIAAAVEAAPGFPICVGTSHARGRVDAVSRRASASPRPR